MQGASPLASPRLNPGGTGAGAAYRALAGGLPRRCRLTLPSLYPAGGGGWGCRSTLPLVCFLPPIPPTPLPRRGRGEPQRLFCRGLRPRHPCAKPPAALTDRTEQVPGGLNPGGTTRREPLSLRFCGKPRVQPRGCKGRSPLHKKTISLPLPAGKGVGGMGAEKQTKGRVRRAAKQASPPPGTTAARSASAAIPGSCKVSYTRTAPPSWTESRHGSERTQRLPAA